ncbi:cell wall-binding repeat-containing protein [Herbiconiux sp. YIM B11900]|uniref:cell wall-binding repeat-containing protein n=1 Tax=Herbiconiux sp. YIM B11900 TaxID=3404131 RepID=UPI003F8446BF
MSTVGLPFESTPFVSPASGEKLSISVAGTVPDGLTVTDSLDGVPRTAQTVTFTVTAVVTASDGTSASAVQDCTMSVVDRPMVTRIAGTDRYDQSVQVSKSRFPTTQPYIVYLASGEKFADALSASAIAASHSSPVLLTPAASLTPGVLAELRRLMPRKIVIVGGPASVSDSVITQLTSSGFLPGAIERIGGADRYAVSRNLISSPEFGIGESSSLYVATGSNFPDALSASPVAAYRGAPVLLVDGSEVSLTDAERAVVKHLRASRIFLVGGPASLSPALQADLALSYTTVRYGGSDRYAVSRAVNSGSFSSRGSVFIASGAVFPDALSGGAIAGALNAPLLITQQDCLSREPALHAGLVGPTSMVILGGLASVGSDVEHLSACAPAPVG